MQWVEDTSKLSKEIQKLKEEIEELNEFRVQKTDLENELEELKIAREMDKKKHKEKMYELEREVMKEKDRLKRENDHMLEEERAKLLELAHSRLHATTKLTMIENEKIVTELTYQAKQTEDLLHENAKLREENKALRRKIDLLTHIEDEFSKKNRANKIALQQLMAQMEAKQIEIKRLESILTEQRNQAAQNRIEQIERQVSPKPKEKLQPLPPKSTTPEDRPNTANLKAHNRFNLSRPLAEIMLPPNLLKSQNIFE